MHAASSADPKLGRAGSRANEEKLIREDHGTTDYGPYDGHRR